MASIRHASLHQLIRLFLAVSLLLGVRPSTAVTPRSNSPVIVMKRSTGKMGLSWSSDQIMQTPLKDRVGQLILAGFNGTTIDENLAEVIEKVRPGGIIVFQRNVVSARQTIDLIRVAQERTYAKITVPLFVAVDQEGGNVVRIKTGPPLPSALALGSTGNASLVRKAGRGIGVALKALGINMNLAPVIDVSDSNKSNFIGTRTFGSNPQLVGKMGAAFSTGLQEAGVMPTAKHFPGQGELAEDAHLKSVVKNDSKRTLMDRDVQPYRIMQQKLRMPWATMLAHVAYPKLDPSNTPATFSKRIVSGILRRELGFQGLVITDDIDMAGAKSGGDIGERAVKSIEAGADMVIVSWGVSQQKKVINSILAAVKKGRLTEKRINESLARILAAKKIYINDLLHNRTDEEVLRALKNPDLIEAAKQTVRISFDRASDGWASRRLPTSSLLPPERVVIFATHRRFYDSFLSGRPHTKSEFVLIPNRASIDINQIMSRRPGAHGLLYVSSQRVARIASQIRPELAQKFIVVNAEIRGEIRNADDFQVIIDLNYRHPWAGRLSAQHFFLPSSLSAGILGQE